VIDPRADFQVDLEIRFGFPLGHLEHAITSGAEFQADILSQTRGHLRPARSPSHPYPQYGITPESPRIFTLFRATKSARIP
jgi:hypothetical protein